MKVRERERGLTVGVTDGEVRYWNWMAAISCWSAMAMG
jgi:hypothetical protein